MPQAIGGGLVLGGAVGNLSERLISGHHGQVADFITLTHWPTFNVADACVTVGVVVVAITLVLGGAAGPARQAMTERTISMEVPALLAGVRVDRGVAMVANVSRTVAAELIAAGRVRVDEVAVTAGAASPARGITDHRDRARAGKRSGPRRKQASTSGSSMPTPNSS